MNQHLKHMDASSRNERLCETLRGMGLFVLPVFAECDPTLMDHMLVSVALPARVEQAAENPAGAPVTVPVPSSEVRMRVKAAEGRGMSVVHFPAILCKRAVIAPADHLAVAIHPVEGAAGDFEGS